MFFLWLFLKGVKRVVSGNECEVLDRFSEIASIIRFNHSLRCHQENLIKIPLHFSHCIRNLTKISTCHVASARYISWIGLIKHSRVFIFTTLNHILNLPSYLMYCYFAAEKATTQSENLLFDIL
jgi:hypothetical protein